MLIAVSGWRALGAVYDFPDWWATTLFAASGAVTLVMVFIIQHTQARLEIATQRKLDELLRSHPDADNRLIAAEVAVRHEELADLAARQLTTPARARGVGRRLSRPPGSRLSRPVPFHVHRVRCVDRREVGRSPLGQRGQRLEVRRLAQQPHERLVLPGVGLGDECAVCAHDRALRLDERSDRLRGQMLRVLHRLRQQVVRRCHPEREADLSALLGREPLRADQQPHRVLTAEQHREQVRARGLRRHCEVGERTADAAASVDISVSSENPMMVAPIPSARPLTAQSSGFGDTLS